MTTTPPPPTSPPPCGICGHGHQFHYAQGGEEGCAVQTIRETGFGPATNRDVFECNCPRYEPKSYDEEPGPTRPEIDHPFGQEIILAKGEFESTAAAYPVDPDRGWDSLAIKSVLRKGLRAWLVRVEVVNELELIETSFVQPKDPL